MQLFDSAVKGSVRAAPVYCTAIINLISSGAHLAMAQDSFPLLMSPLGRLSLVVRWGKKLAISPVLLAMMHSLDVRSDDDMYFLVASAVIQVIGVMCGFSANIVSSTELAYALMATQLLCNMQIIYIFVRSMRRYRFLTLVMTEANDDPSPLRQLINTKLRENKGESSVKAPQKQEQDDILGAVKNVGVVIALKLSVYCCVTWTMHLAVILLGLAGAVSHYQEACLVTFLDMLDKCLYVRVLCSGHGTAISPEGLLARMLILEERANASIRLVSCQVYLCKLRVICCTYLVHALHLSRGVQPTQ
jgi:bacteriorhodopsin